VQAAILTLRALHALSMRTICFSKLVSELALQTGLTRPRSWTEEVSDLGRGLFSFETSASREIQYIVILEIHSDIQVFLISPVFDN
jgi:hypothetical protein